MDKPWRDLKPIPYNGARHAPSCHDMFGREMVVGDLVIVTQYSTPFYGIIRSILKSYSYPRIGVYPVDTKNVYGYTMGRRIHYKVAMWSIKADISLEYLEEILELKEHLANERIVLL